MFLKKFVSSSAIIGWFIAAFLMTNNPLAQAAQSIYYDSTNGNVCGTVISGTSIYANKVIATASVTVNTINVTIGGGSQTNFSTSRYYIMANNPTGGSSSNGAPSTVLATFTPDSISGTGNSTTAKYVGTYSFTSGSVYWVAAAQSAATFPMCYWSPASNALITMNSFIVDTSTSGTNSTWLRAYVTGGTNPIGANWTVPLPNNGTFMFTLENNSASSVATVVTTQSGLGTATFRTITNLQATVDAQSKVTFYANDKVIAGCRNILSSAGTATCAWKPSLHGSYRIFARAVPISSSYTNGTSSYLTVGVGARTNTR